MNYLSINDTPLSAFREEVTKESFFTFSVQQEEYFLNFFTHYEKVTTEIYQFDVGQYTFNIPSGVFVYVGDVSGSTDWMLSDEIVGRKDVETFLMPTDFMTWQLKPLVPKNVVIGEYYIPVIRDAIPIVSECGKRTILISPVDLYHQWKNKDYDAAFVI